MVTAAPAQALSRTPEGAAQTVIVTHILALFAHGPVERHELIPLGTDLHGRKRSGLSAAARFAGSITISVIDLFVKGVSEITLLSSVRRRY